MRLPALLRSRATCALALTLIACGGGGDAPAVDTPATGASPPAAATFTYGTGQVLPGRLVVQNSLGYFDLYDLDSGRSRRVGTEGDDVGWTHGQSPDTLVRWDNNLHGSQPVRVRFLDTATWQPNRADLIVRPEFRYPKLSADNRYVLAFWRDDEKAAEQFNNPMTIIDTATGTILKRDRTLIHGEFDSIVSSPVDWLPDNSYVFLDGNRLYRSTIAAASPTLVATLDLADNQSGGGKASTFVHLVASPDGRRLAFTWNGHLWVVNVDGTGLHRITELSTAGVNTTLGPAFGSPSWSPDSQWVSGVLFRSGTSIAPVFPNPGDSVAPAWQVVGTTGCTSPVFVLRADSAPTVITWPEWPVDHGVRVAGGGGRVLGLSSCSSDVHWIR